MATATKQPRQSWIGPRVVGGQYWDCYWGKDYTVEAISGDRLSMTVRWATGEVTTHCTWWEKRDRVVSQPA